MCIKSVKGYRVRQELPSQEKEMRLCKGAGERAQCRHMLGPKISTQILGEQIEKGASTDSLPDLTCQGAEGNHAQASQSALHLHEVITQTQTPTFPITARGRPVSNRCLHTPVGHSSGSRMCFWLN